MSSPTTTNESANLANKTIVNVGNNIVSVAKKALLVEFPILGAPIIKQVWEALFDFIAGYIERAAETGATFAVIDTQIKQEKSNLSVALKNLMDAERSGDKDAIKKAIQAYADAQSALVHSDGSGSIT